MRKVWQWLLAVIRKYRVVRVTPPAMEPEDFYRTLKSPQTDAFLVAFEQHLRTNGSMDLRLNRIKKSDGQEGYWYTLGYCKAHQDLLGFIKRARRAEGAPEVAERAVKRGGVAQWA